MSFRFPSLLIALLVLCGCNPSASSYRVSEGARQIDFTYSSLLDVQVTDSFTLCQVLDPWNKGQVLSSYVLVERDRPLPALLPEGTLVRTPVERIVSMTTVHSSLLGMLGVEKSLRGVCDKEYIHLDYVTEGLLSGYVVDCGNSQAPSLERILDLEADAVLISPYQDNTGYGNIMTIGIPVIQCADYMETSALGRAEWIRFYGLLTGSLEKGDSIFSSVESHYGELRRKAQQTTSRPKVFSDLKSGSAWYQPGLNSTIGMVIQDAGASLCFPENRGSGSMPMSFEQVLLSADAADFWMVKYNRPQDLTYESIRREDEGYTKFDAWKNRRIFGCNTSYVPFYDEEPYHPDLLLEDLVRIFHPEVMGEGALHFYTPIN